jgi:hypothetical protein
MIMRDNIPENHAVYHIDNNYLNNVRENLKIVSNDMLTRSIKKKEGTTSKYIGVSFRQDTQKWAASYKKVSLGSFKNSSIKFLLFFKRVQMV